MQCTIGQGFGANANPFYKAQGLLGHPAVDSSCGFGTDILFPFKTPSRVINVVTPATAGREGYTLVSILVDDGIECFEWIVGHLNPTVSIGDIVNFGDKLGTEANHGKVYSGNAEITLAMQRAGDTRGHHRHNQKRGLIPTVGTSWRDEYLLGPGWSPYFDGKRYFKIADPYNGYAGCINPSGPVFNRARTIGSSGYDIFVMQRILYRTGFLTAEPTGYFGPLTLVALMRWQSALGLTPAPIIGPMSRQYAQRMLAPAPSFLGN